MVHEVNNGGSGWTDIGLSLIKMVYEEVVEAHGEKKQLWRGQNSSALLPLGSFSHHHVEDEAHSIPYPWSEAVIRYL